MMRGKEVETVTQRAEASPWNSLGLMKSVQVGNFKFGFHWDSLHFVSVRHSHSHIQLDMVTKQQRKNSLKHRQGLRQAPLGL